MAAAAGPAPAGPQPPRRGILNGSSSFTHPVRNLSSERLSCTAVVSSPNRRVASAERMRDASLRALERLHAVLDAEQRRTLAYLIRTGAISF